MGPIQKVGLRVEEMANGMIIDGKWKVEWSFTTQNGRTLTIKALCYYVPDGKARLLSPQPLFSKSNETPGKYIIEEDQPALAFYVILNELLSIHINLSKIIIDKYHFGHHHDGWYKVLPPVSQTLPMGDKFFVMYVFDEPRVHPLSHCISSVYRSPPRNSLIVPLSVLHLATYCVE